MSTLECAQCHYKVINVGKEGHCYMFERDSKEHCGQFKPAKKIEPMISNVLQKGAILDVLFK